MLRKLQGWEFSFQAGEARLGEAGQRLSAWSAWGWRGWGRPQNLGFTPARAPMLTPSPSRSTGAFGGTHQTPKVSPSPPNPWAELPAGWGAAEMMQPPNHRARSRRWDKIWDQFADGKRLKSFNKRDGLGPARRLREGRASLLSGYFHFSSFQRCLGASPLGGGSAAGARGTAPCHQHCPDLRPEAPSPPQRLGGWARG